MRAIALFLLALLAGCATTDYQPYEGKTSLREGDGGTKVTVDSIDFWANGTPPRKFSILGFVTSEIGSGYGDEYLIRSAVAAQAKQVGGNAAIQINNNTSFAGILQTSPGIYMAVNARQMKFAIVKYVTTDH
jgi:hypothetical protein